MAPHAPQRSGRPGVAVEALDLTESSLGGALARALEAGDLDAAERLALERERALDRRPSPARAATPDEATAIRDAARVIASDDLRGRAALGATLEAIRAELAGLAAGASALRAYGPLEALAPGFVDRRD